MEPLLLAVPKNNDDVLACLEQHRGKKIRVVGSLHSWSEAAVAEEVALDVRRLDSIVLDTTVGDGHVYVRVGAGCTVNRVLDYLERHGGYTLPVYGIVGKQTIGGAISTATHGTGRPSLSHYVAAVSVAAYDPETRRPRIFEWSGGVELRAARCAVGCTGVLLSARIRVEPNYELEERGQWFDRLADLLAAAHDYPRSQFYLMPWSWRWYAQLRRPLLRKSKGPRILARLLRGFRLLVVDAMLNGAIRQLAASPKRLPAIPWLFRRVLPLIAPSGVRVIDDARQLQTMRHDLYRHVESELFVPESQVVPAASYVEWVLRNCGGDRQPLPAELRTTDFGCDVGEEIEALRGVYLHDYPVTFRRVLRDDTLISMTSGEDAESWYAISLITYQRDLAPFYRVTRFLATTLARAFRARPHWGKICPLTTGEVAGLYPGLIRFRSHCQVFDPDQVFVNDFARRMLGFPSPLSPEPSRPSR